MTPAERKARWQLGQTSKQTGAKAKTPRALPSNPSSVPRSSVSPTASNANAPTLPPHIQQALGIMGSYRCKYDEAKAILMDANAWGQRDRIPIYRRSAKLSKRQNEIIDAAQHPDVRIVFIEGPRRTGKSTVANVIVYEMGLNGLHRWGMWGATEDSAVRILRDMAQDPHFPEMTEHVANMTAQRVMFDNNTIIETHASKITDTKGLAYEGVWITEFDQLLLNQPLVFGAILAILRSEPNMRIILDANRDTGAYKMFRAKFLDSENDTIKKRTRFFTILKEDVPHIDAAGNDDLIEPLMEIAMGKDKTAEQMHNEESFSGAIFNAQAVMEAFSTYNDWMFAHQYHNIEHQPTTKGVAETIIFIDPGYGHASGITIFSATFDGHVFERESYEFVGKQLDTDIDEKITTRLDEDARRRIKDMHNAAAQQPVELMYFLYFIALKAIEYDAMIGSETNSGMKWNLEFWKSFPGVKGVFSQNFGGDGKSNDRANYCKFVNYMLTERRVHIKDDQLESQLITYNPDSRESSSSKSKEGYKNKGDKADSAIHNIYRLLKKHQNGNNQNKPTMWDGREA